MKSWHVQTSEVPGWSWHGHQLWQGYHWQVQIQSSIITNKKYKKRRTFWRLGFHLKTGWRFQTTKSTKIFQSWQGEQNKGTTTPEKQQLNMDVVNGKKLNQNWKTAFGMKLSELCNTRSKKPSPDPFNFYVVLAGHDMVTDAGRATTCRRKFKTPSLKTYKNERPSQKHEFHLITVWIF